MDPLIFDIISAGRDGGEKMSKFQIDLAKWEIILIDESTKRYPIPAGPRQELLEMIIKSNGEVVPTTVLYNLVYGKNKKALEPNDKQDLSKNYIDKIRVSLRKAFEVSKGTELYADLSNLIVYNKAKDGYYFDNTNNTFDLLFPKQQLKDDMSSQRIDTLYNALMEKINAERKIKDGLVNDFFPNIQMSDSNTYTYFELINKLKSSSGPGKCIILESPYATGKSSILRQMCRTNDMNIYPIHITSSEMQNASISSAILYKYTNSTEVDERNSFLRVKELINLILNHPTHEGELNLPLILIDGYDEMTVQKGEEVLDFITELLNDEHSRIKIIISTRYKNKKMRNRISSRKGLFEISRLQYLDPNVLGDNQKKFKVKKITPLMAKYYTTLASKKLHSDLIVNNRYQLYEQYYDHIFEKKQGYITKYKEFYPYIAFNTLSNNSFVLDNAHLRQLPESASNDYPEVFDELDIPSELRELTIDLIRSGLLKKVGRDTYSFEHPEIKLFMASKFINICLKGNIYDFDSMFFEILDDLMTRLTTSSIEDIYNNHIDYCEFCFMAIIEAIRNKEISDDQQILLLKCGLQVGYYQGYALFTSLRPLIDNYLKSNHIFDFTIIAAINDYLYSILTTELEGGKKEVFVSYIENKLTTCSEIIESLKSNNCLDVKNVSYLYGSAKSILEAPEAKDSTKSPYDALLGVIHGNIGASHLEMGNKVLLDSPKKRSAAISEAIKHHKEGKRYKEDSWGALHRNYIQLATDNYYLSKCDTTPSYKQKHINVAIEEYELAKNELEQETDLHNGKYLTFDSFIIPLNTAGCYYEQYKAYEVTAETFENRLTAIEGLKTNLLEGLLALRSYLDADNHTSPHYVSKEISNIYKDLTTKYLEIFRVARYKAHHNQFKTKFQLGEELVLEIEHFCKIYNEISFFNEISFNPEKITIMENPYD